MAFPPLLQKDSTGDMSRVTRKPDFCLCENKGADQLRSNCEADQRLCFRYTGSTLSLLIKSEISSFYAASGTVHVGLCQTWSETPKTGFLVSRLISFQLCLALVMAMPGKKSMNTTNIKTISVIPMANIRDNCL